MTEIWFIRHGESLSNAGGRVDDMPNIPLTETGRLQAAEVAKKIPRSPDLVITSPYIRTQQTAAPTIARFPTARREIWQVQELTFLAAEKYQGTTRFERSAWAKAYWDKYDPDHIDGPGAESFNDFLNRLRAMIKNLDSAKEDFIIVFAHGYFLHTLEILMANPQLSSVDVMKRLLNIHQTGHMPNAHIIRAHNTGGKVALVNTNPPAPPPEKKSWPKPR